MPVELVGHASAPDLLDACAVDVEHAVVAEQELAVAVLSSHPVDDEPADRERTTVVVGEAAPERQRVDVIEGTVQRFERAVVTERMGPSASTQATTRTSAPAATVAPSVWRRAAFSRASRASQRRARAG